MLLSWLSGCVPTVISEGWQVQLQATDISTLGWLDQPADILVGTTTCFELGWVPSAYAPSPRPRGCFDYTLEGPVSLQDGCLTFHGVGQTAIHFEPFCEGLVRDHLHFQVLAPHEVQARPLDFEGLAEAYLQPGADGLPPRQDGELWRIVETGWFRFFPSLYHLDSQEGVGFELDELEMRTEPASLLIESAQSYGTLILAAGMEGSVTVLYTDELFREEYPLASVLGVAESEAASLEVIPVYLPEGYLREPLAARAVVRDAAGNLLWGAPVRWSLDEGELAYGDLDVPLPGPDYVLLDGDCVPPEQGGTRQAVLRASLGALTDTATLRWTTTASYDPLWQPHPDCQQGVPYEPPEPPDLQEPDPGQLVPPDGPSWQTARWSGGACTCAAPVGSGSWPALLAGLWALTCAGGTTTRARPARQPNQAGSSHSRSRPCPPPRSRLRG